jgi:peptide/nickel transport system ATP-binding protein
MFGQTSASLDPLQTIGSHLSEALRARYPLTDKVARERIGDWLQAIGIPQARSADYPRQLSDVQCQRLALALALCTQPELLVADAPTAGLDVPQRAQLAALLRRMARGQRTAVLLLSGDPRSVAAAADRVAVMYAGRLVETGAAAEVLRAPAHPYTAALLASLPGTARRPRLPVPEGAPPQPGAVPAGCAFHPRCGRVVARCRAERPPLPAAGAACWRPVVGPALAAGGHA